MGSDVNGWPPWNIGVYRLGYISFVIFFSAGDLQEYDVLSLNLLSNAINAIVELKGLNKVRR